jgi:hypothetical protein
MLAGYVSDTAASAQMGVAMTDTSWPHDNPFFDRWAVDAAFEHLRSPAEQVETIAANDDYGAVLPLSPWLKMPLGPGPVWTVWSHIHSYDATPAIEDDRLLDAAFDFLRTRRASMLRWGGLPTDTLSYARLLDYLRCRNLEFQVTKSGRRPMLVAEHPQGSKYVDDYLGGKRLREFRR